MDHAGYMSSSQQQQDSPAKKRVSGASQTVVPLSIRQALEATQSPDDSWLVNGQEVSLVVIVGLVISVTESSTNVSMQLEDGTGRITIKRWLESNRGPTVSNDVREGNYVRALGSLRSWRNEHSLLAQRVQILSDMNEVTFHNVSVMWTAHQRSAASAAAAAPQAMKHEYGAAAAYGAPGAASMAGRAPAMATSSGFNAPSAYGSGAHNPANAVGSELADPVHRDVLRAVKSAAASDAGASIQYLRGAIGQHVSNAALREALEHLTSEGYLYTTRDDDHYKPTD